MRAILTVLVVVNVLLLAASQLGLVSSSAPIRAAATPSVVPDSAPTLTLLSERSDPPVSEPVGTRGRPSSEIGSVAGSLPMCTLLGPFAEPSDAEAIGLRLQSLDVSAEVRDIEVSDGQGYWVHLAPELSQRAALRKLHELQAKQIDSYVIPRGELANGISFGMFSREALALARRDELKTLGYEAKIREIERTHRETWVVMPLIQSRGLSDRLWEELLAEASGLERRQNLCPGVASE